MGDSISVYIQNDELIEAAQERIDDGEFRNMSHLVEAGMESIVYE